MEHKRRHYLVQLAESDLKQINKCSTVKQTITTKGVETNSWELTAVANCILLNIAFLSKDLPMHVKSETRVSEEAAHATADINTPEVQTQPATKKVVDR